MAITNITYLKEFDASMVNAVIKVRIIKLWNKPSFKIPNGIHIVEMILMDEQGTKIQANVNNTYLRKLEKLLVEKHCLVIEKQFLLNFKEDNFSFCVCFEMT